LAIQEFTHLITEGACW